MDRTPLPVTAAISRRPRPGRDGELAGWATRIAATAAAFPGHLGAQVFPADPPGREDLTIVFSFATARELAAWEASPERARLLTAGAGLTEGPQRAHTLTGLEGLFTGAARPASAPSRWRTAVVIALAMYPLSLLATLLLAPRLSGLPVPVRTVVTTAVMVPLMVWAAVPLVSTVLRRWLVRAR